jgi:hypothetical protein
MKNVLSWKLPLSESEMTQLWGEAIFVFDTNFLLDLYRVSRPVTDKYLEVLEYLQENIWLPYQVANEFIDRREGVIGAERASFENALQRLNGWSEETKKSPNKLDGVFDQAKGRVLKAQVAPLLAANYDAYIAAVEEVEKVFREKIKIVAESHNIPDPDNDDILNRLLEILGDRVGSAYDEQRLKDVHQEGEDRYEKLIPPGFADKKAKEGDNKYGDLVVWKQILDFAKDKACAVIFVTSEKKDDWWAKKGKTNAPHPLLRREFQEVVKQGFWMYHTTEFIQVAQKRLNVQFEQSAVDEITAVTADLEDDLNCDTSQEIGDSQEVRGNPQKPATARLAGSILRENSGISSSMESLNEVVAATTRLAGNILRENSGISEYVKSLNKAISELSSISSISSIASLNSSMSGLDSKVLAAGRNSTFAALELRRNAIEAIAPKPFSGLAASLASMDSGISGFNKNALAAGLNPTLSVFESSGRAIDAMGSMNVSGLAASLASANSSMSGLAPEALAAKIDPTFPALEASRKALETIAPKNLNGGHGTPRLQ